MTGPLGQATIAVSGVALALGVILIWVPDAQDGELVARALGIALAAMIACVHASLMCGRISSRDGGVVAGRERQQASHEQCGARDQAPC